MLEKSKFTKIDEEFICENCGKKVPKLGYTCRNHCPYCIHSKHLDINPGDRAEDCHGILEPIGIETNSKKGYVIIFKCEKCGAIRKNKVAEDDNMDEIIRISCQKGRVFLTTLEQKKKRFIEKRFLCSFYFSIFQTFSTYMDSFNFSINISFYCS